MRGAVSLAGVENLAGLRLGGNTAESDAARIITTPAAPVNLAWELP